MTFQTGGRAGLLALFDPIAVAPYAMIHNPFFRQFALVFQILDDTQPLGKYIMTDVAVSQRRLMLSMGKNNHAFLASVKGYLFGAFFSIPATMTTALKSTNTTHNITIFDFMRTTFIKIKLQIPNRLHHGQDPLGSLCP
jgi:hypothetical protein